MFILFQTYHLLYLLMKINRLLLSFGLANYDHIMWLLLYWIDILFLIAFWPWKSWKRAILILSEKYVRNKWSAQILHLNESAILSQHFWTICTKKYWKEFWNNLGLFHDKIFIEPFFLIWFSIYYPLHTVGVTSLFMANHGANSIK